MMNKYLEIRKAIGRDKINFVRYHIVKQLFFNIEQSISYLYFLPIMLSDNKGKEIIEGHIVEDALSDGANSVGIVTLNPGLWGNEPFIYGINDAFSYKGFLELVDRKRIFIVGHIMNDDDMEYFMNRIKNV